jgi:hypothetical protein
MHLLIRMALTLAEGPVKQLRNRVRNGREEVHEPQQERHASGTDGEAVAHGDGLWDYPGEVLVNT